jgi:hypothetical protein
MNGQEQANWPVSQAEQAWLVHRAQAVAGMAIMDQ